MDMAAGNLTATDAAYGPRHHEFHDTTAVYNQ